MAISVANQRSVSSWTDRLEAVVIVVFVICFFQVSAPSLASGQEDVQSFFSVSHQETREKFLTATKTAGTEISHYKNPEFGVHGVHGVHGVPLFTDTASFNLKGAETIVVIGSGTHGVEGYSGSGIQTGLLRSGFLTQLETGVGVLFYHALNPYGFSHLRYVNEDNIDLNRNFVDHSSSHPSNDEYDRLASLLEPDSLSRWDTLKTQLGIGWYRLTKVKPWLQRAISQGQYSHPRGLFFGGDSDTWSNSTLREIVKAYFAHAKRIVLIGFHTGLGEYGAAEVIVGEHPHTATFKRAKRWWGDIVKSPIVKSPNAGDSVSPPIKGSLKYAFARMATDTEITAVTLEFGTYPPLKVFLGIVAGKFCSP